jgi:starch synthase
VLEAAKQLGVPDIFHVHDWQAALLPVLLRSVYYFDPALRSAGTVLTVHNAGYQGRFPANTIQQLLLPWDMFTYDKVEQDNNFNFLKGGLVYSDYLTTVSQTYAQEIQTQEFGAGLEAFFSRGMLICGHSERRGLREVESGARSQLGGTLLFGGSAGKVECRRDLLHAFGLTNVADSTAVIGMVSRFATQKGLDFVVQIADQMAERDLVVVALGDGEPYYENFFRSWAQRRPNQVAVQLKYDDAVAHKVEAGSDIFLMPSRYEPCGLNQIYSLKYGTVPVVRATGGLEDTVEEWNAETGTGTGFKFYGYNAQDLMAAIDRALAAFQDKVGWRKLMRMGWRRIMPGSIRRGRM